MFCDRPAARAALLCAAALMLSAIGLRAAPPHAAAAAAGPPPPARERQTALLVYSTADHDASADTRLLDLLVGQFADEVRPVADIDLRAADVAGSTHVIYYGEVERPLPAEAADILQRHRGPLLAIGANSEQLGTRFAFAAVTGLALIDRVALPGRELPQPAPSVIRSVAVSRGETLIRGDRGKVTHPLYVADGQSHYFAGGLTDGPLQLALTMGMAQLFDADLPARHTAHIRLEDIHPAADPGLVRAVGDYLADRGIPFVLVVIPVYIDPDTGRHIKLADRPELVRALRHLQRRGGAVIQHGYTHQYRADETGEGFEFWDVDNDSPVYGPADEPYALRPRSAFASETAYLRHLALRETFERDYTRDRIRRGREELRALGLEPFAFEAPHYAMSPAGYKVVATEYDLLLGQVQTRDDTWRAMARTPYLSRPAFLQGMTFLPETLGYYDPDSPDPMADIRQQAAPMLAAPGSVLGIFYHPYLGLGPLQEIFSYLDQFEDLDWTDIRTLAPAAPALPGGQAWLDARLLWRQWLMTGPFDGGLQRALWLLAAMASAATAQFLHHASRNRAHRRVILFEERLLNG